MLLTPVWQLYSGIVKGFAYLFCGIAAGKKGELKPSKYNLIANVVHDGQPDQGSYRVHMHRRIEDQWYEVENLRVVDILPQVVALSETYMQVYELKSEK